MKTVFDKTTRDDLIERINKLNENSTAQWGRMNIYQMLKHCTLWQEWILGRKKYRRVFLGRFFGKMALKNALKDESPMMKNAVSISAFKIKETDGDVDSEKKKWIVLTAEFADFSNPGF